jgi:hypothetical protein
MRRSQRRGEFGAIPFPRVGEIVEAGAQVAEGAGKGAGLLVGSI